MLNSNDIYSHLSNGGDPQELLDALLKEINSAEQKIKAEKEMEAAAAEEKQKKADAKKNLLLSAQTYLALVGLPITYETLEEALDEMETALDALKNLSVKVNGKKLDLADLLSMI